MRYKYMVTDQAGNTETVEAMSYKKMLKKLKPLTTYKIEYQNKKNHHLVKMVTTKKHD
tara:strand:- start:356 stop:529 length:174 start_codon:yes stop_codon:yes gene_type:complete